MWMRLNNGDSNVESRIAEPGGRPVAIALDTVCPVSLICAYPRTLVLTSGFSNDGTIERTRDQDWSDERRHRCS